ncbi:sigma-54-dependent transcriptional regulator [Xanthobacter agilis]|uniref:Two-component system repressor protein LuxO n=1 Tax=Xanthobacter agilis TaxID=47492 RepID=A0ABU0L9V2_XANAG|nr:sigma-54 dependent transcriptional regulator [Xanthobacter agilis]MDQ0503918.1 two-component system repressor protein LuxO [Xanthobacter agilis]
MTAVRPVQSTRVLVCDPDPALRRMMRAALARRGVLNMIEVEGLDAAFTASANCDAALICVPQGEEAIVARLRAAGLTGTLVVSLAQGSVAGAVAAMRAGADDVVLKPVKAEDVVERLLTAPGGRPERRRALREDRRPSPTAQNGDFYGFLGRSAPMLQLYERINRVAPSRAPVFVTGESGTGKELAASAVHARSPRHTAPFHALNCGAIPRELMESEIFGHARGAFTGAHADRAGAAELADGGTLFLDEIGEMDLALQSKLLRFLQDGKVRRIGEGHERQVDVRIVCATNRDPVAEVKAGRLREDLFYRLHVLNLHLPPLRERGDDVIRLAEAFLARFAGEEGRPLPRLTADVCAVLLRRQWRGNVRELQNLMRRAVVLSEGGVLSPALFAEDRMAVPVINAPEPAADAGVSLAEGCPSPSDDAAAKVEPLAVTERRAIEGAIAAFQGNIALAAAALDLSPSTLYRKKQSWEQGARREGSARAAGTHHMA